MRIPIILALGCALLFAEYCSADTILNGYVNDPSNANLVGSDLGAALFGSDYDIADNVALYTISVGDGNETFTSKGFALGGVDPYFTLFSGTGNLATFVGSNFNQAFSTGGDFSLTFSLVAGNYTVAIGTYANDSSAENAGTGTLGDGFTFFGSPDSLGNGYYELDISQGQASVPEPSSSILISLPLILLIAWRIRKDALIQN
ncbi:MAG TPA: DVUA0089 family protein [Terriglobia bacterium]|jgi:hypothetical protein